MSAPILALFVLNGAQGVLVLIVWLRLGAILIRQREFEAQRRKHDEDLIAKVGQEFYKQLNAVMDARFEAKILKGPRPSKRPSPLRGL